MMVTYKDNEYKVYEVFDVSYDHSGYPHFLIYKDGQWLRRSAKHFVPYIEKDVGTMTLNSDGSFESRVERVVVR